MPQIQFEIKRFNELSAAELYNLLQLRAEVFIVEQNCVYQDIDGKDYKALHLIGTYEGKIVAYSRLFKAGDYFDNASIGRVVIAANYRYKKWGHSLVQAGIAGIEKHFNTTRITISAQLYLQKFYESNGFVAVSDTYLEDDIPHIEMLKS
ncbi:GNAT family N-acetyltransferase [Flavobacterium sp. 3HN19-14]|uniref:GNAT family N-acetyltransferase n=1 Tax=Flavobacterium sp. 3HN19-14 TaxID=3448133 RepID=UPI003EE35FBA